MLEFRALGERATAAIHAAETARRAGTGADLLLPLIQAVAQRNPLDEALAAEVVRLLASVDRWDEARAWYLATEASLGDQLGVLPGPALTAAFQGLSTVRPGQLPPDPWLFGGRRSELDALTREATDRLRERTTLALHGGPAFVIDLARARQSRPTETPVLNMDWASAAEDTTEAAIATQSILTAFDNLSDAHRTVLTNLHFHGETADEVAKKLHVPVGTVKSRAHYALRALRDGMSAVD